MALYLGSTDTASGKAAVGLSGFAGMVPNAPDVAVWGCAALRLGWRLGAEGWGLELMGGLGGLGGLGGCHTSSVYAMASMRPTDPTTMIWQLLSPPTPLAPSASFANLTDRPVPPRRFALPSPVAAPGLAWGF